MRHLCSSISYGGADSLADLRARFASDPMRYVIRLSAAARRESVRAIAKAGLRASSQPSRRYGPAISGRDRGILQCFRLQAEDCV